MDDSQVLLHTLHDKLERVGQTHLLQHWEELSDEKRHQLFLQIENLDESLFERLKNFLIDPPKQEQHVYRAPREVAEKTRVAHPLAKEYLKKGKVGIAVLAGGQASRLHLEGPKGCVFVTPVKEKTLFEYFSQKVNALCQKYQIQLHVAIMTSPQNHLETVRYFRDNQFFGLKHLTFFEQESYPLFDGHHFLFLENKYRIAEGPNGNGSFYHQFVGSGLLDKWRNEGVEQLQLVAIDNPLLDPLLEGELGFHLENQNEVTLYCDYALSNEEKVGVVVEHNGQLSVIDYMEREESHFTEALYANLGIYFLSLSFIERAAKQRLPLHPVKKCVPQLFGEQTLRPKEPNAWKFETFIFDAFSEAKKWGVLRVPRQECFAPLKNIRGDESIDTVKQALYEKDCASLANHLPNATIPPFPFELHPAYHYLPIIDEKKDLQHYVDWRQQ